MSISCYTSCAPMPKVFGREKDPDREHTTGTTCATIALIIAAIVVPYFLMAACLVGVIVFSVTSLVSRLVLPVPLKSETASVLPKN